MASCGPRRRKGARYCAPLWSGTAEKPGNRNPVVVETQEPRAAPLVTSVFVSLGCYNVDGLSH